MPRLTWREGRPGDRPALQQFECTRRYKDRLGRTRYQRGWERNVEAEIRQLNPCGDDRSVVLLGEDEEGLAAVAVVGVIGELDDYMVDAVAVALRCRYQPDPDDRLGDEALNEAIQWAINSADAAGYPVVHVVARLDSRNKASRRLLQRSGFIPLFGVRPEAWAYDALIG